jgi:hypothetical protein
MERARRTVVRFPSERVQRSARGDATWIEIGLGLLRQWLGRALNLAAIPGAIQPMEFDDRLAGQRISTTVGELFVCVSVNGRDYYFNRITGRFDGTGSSPG